MPDDPRRFYSSVFDRPSWNRASWFQVALCVEETGENPPLLGLIFSDQAAGKALFDDLMKRVGRSDPHRELRIALIEDAPGGEKPAYTVHIGPDPAAVEARLKADGVTLEPPPALDLRGVWVRGVTSAGSTLVADFKAQHEKHGSVLVAPFLGPRGKLAPSLELCITTSMKFRSAADVTADASDLDAPLLAKDAKK
jgi:hypothetical protein